jgi:hypothetical protein
MDLQSYSFFHGGTSVKVIEQYKLFVCSCAVVFKSHLFYTIFSVSQCARIIEGYYYTLL